MTGPSVRRGTWAVLAVVLIVLLTGVFAMVSLQETPPQGGPPPSVPPGTSPQAPPPPASNSTPVPAHCPPAAVTVTTAAELTEALAAPGPGTVITLADGVYRGNFTATGAGTAEQPIILCGGTGAVLDGGGTEDGYVLHLDQASYWTVQGFTVRNGQKGVMVDEGTHIHLQGLTVENTGDEAIHLRRFSSDNKVTGNTIRGAGLRKPKFGEGIYIGTAESNWCDVTACEPDRSDRNEIRGNTVSGTTAESIDIKEGTSDGVLADNTFDGSAMAEADSWVDVKGRGWRIEGNTGRNSPQDGFQTHEIVDGWGTENVFHNNVAEVNGPGLGYSLKPARDNVVDCSNTASQAGQGLSNITCTS
ncbi:nitrous oxide reductase family maturation protein NosD [Arthrobacter sp. MPF02]|uniref:right-handed parallel beta-helix repeat-containing protein n=1 Tax=Arthrobacter sp. MPF02 TaxID=3388492 RepID=UPI0039855DA3